MLNKNTSKPRTQYESLHDLNLISLWWQSGSNWSLTIQEDIQADIEQPIAQEESNPTSKLVLFGVVAALAILITTAFSQAPKIYQSVQEVGINSFKEVMSKN
jgi:hypothetical protein